MGPKNCGSNSRFQYFIMSFLTIQNVGLHFETWNAGVLGPVSLSGLNEGTRDLTKQKWSYKVYFLLISFPRICFLKCKVVFEE